MALKVGDNFSYQGQKPNFERDTFSTLAAMKSFPTTSIDEGHISLCLEDGKRYKYSASFSVDPTLGKWRRVIDSVLDASSENPVQNKVILSKFREDEAAFAQQIAALSQTTTTNLEGTRQALLTEDARNRQEIEALIAAGSNAASTALANLRKDVEDVEAATAASLNDKVGQTRTINGYDLSEDVILDKTDVGLGNVDNTSDADKPVSTLTQLAIDKKVDKQEGYSLICKVRDIFKRKLTIDEAKHRLHEWYKDVNICTLREIKAARDCIKSREPEVLNYFINRATNASAESLNSKMKGFRAQLHGIADIPFFMYRICNIFG